MNIEINNLQNLEHFICKNDEVERRVFITGASGSGKSTLWKVLRDNLLGNVHFPVRLISRVNRKDDNISENQHLKFEDFEPLFFNKSIEFFWSKFLPERTEYYGFEFNKSKSIIYGCNNEFLSNISSLKSHSNLFEKSLIIHVKCNIEIRKKRLIERFSSQNISSKEIDYRIKSDKVEIDLLNKCHIIFHNNSSDILEPTNDLIKLLALN